jgi:SAM-dependent methyltransferase
VVSVLAGDAAGGEKSLLHVGAADPAVLEVFMRMGLDVRCASDVDAVGRIPFPATTFDFTYAESILERASSLSCILSESLRVLRPGGRAMFVSPLHAESAQLDDRVIRTFTRRTLREALIVHGFESVVCYRFSTGWPARVPLSVPLARWVASLPDWLHDALPAGQLGAPDDACLVGVGTRATTVPVRAVPTPAESWLFGASKLAPLGPSYATMEKRR